MASIKQAKPATSRASIQRQQHFHFFIHRTARHSSSSLPPPPGKQAKRRAPPVDHCQHDGSNGIFIGNASLKPGKEKAASSAVIVAVDRIVRPIIGESDKSGKNEEEGGGIGVANPLALE